MIVVLFLSLFTHGMIFLGPIVKIAGAVDVTTWQDTNTTINVTVNSEEPTINWYDFKNSTDASKLDTRIDVNEMYKFCINITDYQGWSDIDYVNVTAWFDNGSEATTYNQTSGGNLNMMLQYENTTGTANWSMLWPDDEVEFNSSNCTETYVDDNTTNLTFEFTPLYQVRYSSAGTGTWSWNFNITCSDASEDNASVEDEYGVFMYTRITQTTENPYTEANPGDNDLALDPHTNVTTRCNANYSLSTNLPNLTDGASHYILNTSVSAQGGDLARTNFDGQNESYIYGTSTTYRNHLVNTYEDTVKIRYWINITLGQFAGNYSSTVTYTINGEV
jgi:hypothetical protein